MLVIDNVWGDCAPSSGIGPVFGQASLWMTVSFFEAINARKEAFRGRIGVRVRWEEDLECRLKISMKVPNCDGQNFATSNLVSSIEEHTEREDAFQVRSTGVVPV